MSKTSHGSDTSEGRSWSESHLLQALLDNVPDHIYFKDLDSRFILINKAQAEILGVPHPDEAIGKSDADFFSDEHAHQARVDEEKIIKTGKPMVGVEEKETWPDGSVTWASTTKAPLIDDEGRIIGTFGISRDITEVKMAREAIETAEKHKVMLQSLGSACHYMSQPLTVLLSSAELIKSRAGEMDPSMSSLIQQVIDSAGALGSTIHKLNEVNEYRVEKYTEDSDIVGI